MDTLTKEQRSKSMKNTKSTNTEIEILLRKALWKKGLRYKINYNKIPGNPDMVFTKNKIAIFCDGEFYHGFDWINVRDKIGTNKHYWIKKIERNIQRDIEVNKQLEELGWVVLRFWGKDIKKHTEECVNRVVSTIEKRKDMYIPKPEMVQQK